MGEQNSIIPVTDAQAEAVKAGFKFASDSLETARSFAGYAAWALGTLPQDIVGLLGADWVKVKRAENMERVMRRAKARLEQEGKEAEPLALSVGLPLLEAAADEDREELVDLWARLLEGAMDPARNPRMRQRYIDVVKRMDPMDTRVLPLFANGPAPSNMINFIAQRLGLTDDEVYVSVMNLGELGCLEPRGVSANSVRPNWTNPALSPQGRELLFLLGPREA